MDKISKNRIKNLGQPTRGCDGAGKVLSVSLRKTDPEYGTLVEYSNTTNHKQTGMSNKMNNPYYLNQ